MNIQIVRPKFAYISCLNQGCCRGYTRVYDVYLPPSFLEVRIPTYSGSIHIKCACVYPPPNNRPTCVYPPLFSTIHHWLKYQIKLYKSSENDYNLKLMYDDVLLEYFIMPGLTILGDLESHISECCQLLYCWAQYSKEQLPL